MSEPVPTPASEKQINRNEWGYPEMSNGDSYLDPPFQDNTPEWPAGPVPNGYVQLESLNDDLKSKVYAKPAKDTQPIPVIPDLGTLDQLVATLNTLLTTLESQGIVRTK